MSSEAKALAVFKNIFLLDLKQYLCFLKSPKVVLTANELLQKNAPHSSRISSMMRSYRKKKKKKTSREGIWEWPPNTAVMRTRCSSKHPGFRHPEVPVPLNPSSCWSSTHVSGDSAAQWELSGRHSCYRFLLWRFTWQFLGLISCSRFLSGRFYGTNKCSVAVGGSSQHSFCLTHDLLFESREERKRACLFFWCCDPKLKGSAEPSGSPSMSGFLYWRWKTLK